MTDGTGQPVRKFCAGAFLPTVVIELGRFVSTALPVLSSAICRARSGVDPDVRK